MLDLLRFFRTVCKPLGISSKVSATYLDPMFHVSIHGNNSSIKKITMNFESQ